MGVQLTIDYEQVVELVEQLSAEQQRKLIARLLRQPPQRPLTAAERIQLFDAAKLHQPVNEAPSVRRQDWYDDDGR